MTSFPTSAWEAVLEQRKEYIERLGGPSTGESATFNPKDGLTVVVQEGSFNLSPAKALDLGSWIVAYVGLITKDGEIITRLITASVPFEIKKDDGKVQLKAEGWIPLR